MTSKTTEFEEPVAMDLSTGGFSLNCYKCMRCGKDFTLQHEELVEIYCPYCGERII